MYKQSKYNVIVPHSNIYILYNTATSAILELNEEYYTNLISNNWQRFSQDEILLLRDQGFIKFLEEDENFYQSLLRKSAICKKINGITAITILPTTECNARCAYCYENGIFRDTMQEETIDSLISFILKYISPEKKLSINWHGGEPLLEHTKITKICKALKKENIEIQSSMSSNGSLFNIEMVETALNIWHLNQIQITIDGIEDDYNLVKNYSNVDNAFNRVINNVEILLKKGINVTVRVNFEYKNIDKTFITLEWLHEKFGLYKGFGLYAHPLFQEIDKYVNDNPKDHLMFKLYLKNLEYNNRNIDNLIKWIDKPCGAILFNSFCVSPSGKLYLCQHAESSKPDENVGNLWTGPIINRTYMSWCTDQLEYEECQNCILLPCCQGGCKAAYFYEGRTPCVLYKPFYKELIKLIYENSIKECYS